MNHPERMRAANEIPTGERLQPSQTMDHQAYEQACEQLQKVDSRIPPDVIKKAIQLFFSTHLLPDYDLTQAQVRELPATNMLALILPLPDTSHFQMPPPFHKRQNHTWALLHGTTLHTSQLISLKVRSDQPTGLIIKTFNAVTCQPSGPSTLAEKLQTATRPSQIGRQESYTRRHPEERERTTRHCHWGDVSRSTFPQRVERWRQ